ncbi:flagellar motor protein MotD [Acidihalobacter ferrooxydans]|uniref:OmpA-like domain-containing protein n=1 Tax=Acidihalobacter ferrooxydans TaxID=1765967 RepID=A0A1P8UGQ4_9GAMM|nr:flagellar motor protein MotD [Acidihalobacter ferrooxydans]APZ43028.1 hypothetical protein BW247_07915 [Acidihalobacter ferrooxydans]
MARGRRKSHEEHINHERWLVSYADFITLLFAFFVVMYAISSVNVGKYRVLSESLVAAFRNPAASMKPIQIGKVQTSNPDSFSPLNAFPSPLQLHGIEQTLLRQPIHPPVEHSSAKRTPMEKMGALIVRKLSGLIQKGLVSVRIHPDWVDIMINADVLFPNASAALAPHARNVLEQVAHSLNALPIQVQVEGFTDNKPIHTREFSSNWSLSAARAVSVVELLVKNGMSPKRLAAVGYGQYHPVASNATPKGRAQNRRVELVVVAQNTVMPTRQMKAAVQAGGG